MPLTKKKFVEFLHQPRKMAQTDLNEIELLVRKYPYFQTGRTLLAKGKKIHQPDKSAKYIETAAVYATDRAHLKKFITSDLFFLNPPTHTDEIISESVSSKSHEKNNLPASSEVKLSEVRAINENLSDFPLSTTSTSDLDLLIAEIFQDLEEMKKSKARFMEMEARLENDSDNTQPATIKNNTVENEDPSKKEKKTSRPTNSLTEKKQEKSIEISPEVKEVIQKVKQEEEKNQIIEEFIKKEPSISKAKKTKPDEPEIKTDLSEKSSRFKVDVTSEYLAEIYIGQGKHHRAIEIYESLSLKFPEKTDYFAALIEKLKKK